MYSRVHFHFYQWKTLLKEVEKLAAMSKNYLKKRQFYKVNSYLQIRLISKTCEGRNSCPLAMKASSTCSYAVTLRLLSRVHSCCRTTHAGRLCVTCVAISALHYLMPSSAFLDRSKYHSYCSSLSRLESSVLTVCSWYLTK